MVPHPSLGVEAQTFDLEGHLVDADLKRENVVGKSNKIGGLEVNRSRRKNKPGGWSDNLEG